MPLCEWDRVTTLSATISGKRLSRNRMGAVQAKKAAVRPLHPKKRSPYRFRWLYFLVACCSDRGAFFGLFFQMPGIAAPHLGQLPFLSRLSVLSWQERRTSTVPHSVETLW